MTHMQIAVLGVAGASAVATYFVALNELRNHEISVSKQKIAGCAAILSFFGMIAAGPIIVVGATALAVLCIAVFCYRIFSAQGFFNSNNRTPLGFSSPRSRNAQSSQASQPTVDAQSRTKPRQNSTSSHNPIIPLDVPKSKAAGTSSDDKK